jgi:hypothetical protein
MKLSTISSVQIIVCFHSNYYLVKILLLLFYMYDCNNCFLPCTFCVSTYNAYILNFYFLSTVITTVEKNRNIVYALEESSNLQTTVLISIFIVN